MYFRTKVQPININGIRDATPPIAIKQAPGFRLKQLFERQFGLKNFSGVDQLLSRSDSEEFEPSSLCLRKMVERYIEDPEEENPPRHGRNHCKCFTGCSTDSSDEDEDESSPSGRVLQSLKSLLLCTNIYESDLVRKATEIVEKDNKYKSENESQLKTVADELVALGYDAAICKSHWYRCPRSIANACPCPAGEYEYIDVIIGNDRVIIDFDFKSKFQIARPSKNFKKLQKMLPHIFVGQVDHLKKVVIVVSKAAKKSFIKKGLSVPPWRRAEYVMTKWLSPYERAK